MKNQALSKGILSWYMPWKELPYHWCIDIIHLIKPTFLFFRIFFYYSVVFFFLANVWFRFLAKSSIYTTNHLQEKKHRSIHSQIFRKAWMCWYTDFPLEDTPRYTGGAKHPFQITKRQMPLRCFTHSVCKHLQRSCNRPRPDFFSKHNWRHRKMPASWAVAKKKCWVPFRKVEGFEHNMILETMVYSMILESNVIYFNMYACLHACEHVCLYIY